MSSDSSYTRCVVCFHGLIANVLTSNTDKNPSRRYYRCPNEDDEKCKFFQWVDEELPSFKKVRFLKLKSQNNLLEEQLKCTKYYESLLAEKLELKENEITRLQNKLDDLEKTIAQLELKENEIFRLQNKNEDLEKTIHAMCKLQNKNEELEKAIHAMCKRKKIERKLILLVLVFCVAMYWNGVGNGNGRLMLK
ncbi:GRF zinc finger family protein [Striga asiatica]|uniref:GRF zinc finger family protein n=1 Tax=Striga asiatica TaxID=4170 RepID=A0A5A7Q3T6_STRAF|nr:GRF zinc finger family protein [Striga asiatica]